MKRNIFYAILLATSLMNQTWACHKDDSSSDEEKSPRSAKKIKTPEDLLNQARQLEQEQKFDEALKVHGQRIAALEKILRNIKVDNFSRTDEREKHYADLYRAKTLRYLGHAHLDLTHVHSRIDRSSPQIVEEYLNAIARYQLALAIPAVEAPFAGDPPLMARFGDLGYLASMYRNLGIHVLNEKLVTKEDYLEKAIKTYDDALQIQGIPGKDRSHVLLDQASLHRLKGRLKEAKILLQQVIVDRETTNTHRAHAHVDLGYILGEQEGQYQLAIEEYNKAIASKAHPYPQDAERLLKSARSNLSIARHAEISRAIEQKISESASLSELKKHASDLQLKTIGLAGTSREQMEKQSSDARAAFESALLKYPEIVALQQEQAALGVQR